MGMRFKWGPDLRATWRILVDITGGEAEKWKADCETQGWPGGLDYEDRLLAPSAQSWPPVMRRIEAVGQQKHRDLIDRYLWEAEVHIGDLIDSLWGEAAQRVAGPEDIVKPIELKKLTPPQLQEYGSRPLLAINPTLASIYCKRELQKQVGLWFDREIGRRKGRPGRPSAYSKRVAIFYGDRVQASRQARSDARIVIGAVRDCLYFKIAKKYRKGPAPTR